MKAAASMAALIERRRCPRTHSNIPILLIVENDGKMMTRAGTALDVSELGARIGTSVHLTVGQPVKLIRHEEGSDFVPCRVVWLGSQASGTRQAGIEFLS